MSRLHPPLLDVSSALACAEIRAKTIGAWTLAPGRAMRLRPRRAGHVLVLGGRAWVTASAPFDAAARRFGDGVLQAGDRLAVAAGARLVIEPLAGPLRFEWREPEPEPSRPGRFQPWLARARAWWAMCSPMKLATK